MLSAEENSHVGKLEDYRGGCGMGEERGWGEGEVMRKEVTWLQCDPVVCTYL